MKKSLCFLAFSSLLLTACQLTPEQKAERAAQQLRAEQARQVHLASLCDLETSQLMAAKFNPPLHQTEQEKADFEKRYIEKINNPVFQACYQLAVKSEHTEQELERLRYDYEREMFWHRPYFCYTCW